MRPLRSTTEEMDVSNLYRVVKQFMDNDTDEITEEQSLVTGISVEQVCANAVEQIACDGRYELMSITNVGSVVQSLEIEEFEPKYEPR